MKKTAELQTQIAFIDACLADRSSLMAALPPNIETCFLDPDHDGLSQIAAALIDKTDVFTVHLISHGAPGKLLIGKSVVDLDALKKNVTALASIAKAMGDEGELLIYGCEVAAKREGRLFIDSLAQFTGAKVAAATHKVGHAALGGSWGLNISTAEMRAAPLRLDSWQHTLALVSLTNEGFETGDATGWTLLTSNGVKTVVTGEQTVTAGSFTWKVSPDLSYMLRLEPGNSTGTGGNLNDTSTALSLSAASKTYLTNVFTTPTSFSSVYRDVTLAAGDTFELAWNYIATDYKPYNDASFASFVPLDGSKTPGEINGLAAEVSLLGATVAGTSNWTTGDYGSTGWQTVTYSAIAAGSYRIGFSVFNIGDTALSPILFVDEKAGTTKKNGVNFDPVQTDANAPAPPVPVLSYSSTSLNEDVANDGSITGTITITLKGDTFTGTNGADWSALVSNVPTGLTAVLTRSSSTTASLSFSGKATNHADSNDVNNLTVTFTNSYFTGGSAASVSGAVKSNLSINFDDPVGPKFVSAATSTDGKKVILTYNGALNSTTADKSAFTVTAGGTPISVDAVAVVGSTVELTLASAISEGQTVTVAYTDDPAADDASAIQDASGNDAISIDKSVQNVVDLTAPVFSSAATSTDGNKVILTYNGALNSTTADKSAFTVTAGGTPITVDAVAVVGSTVELTLASAISEGQTVTVAYTDDPAADDASAIQDAAGNDAVSIGPGQSVENVVDLTAPVFSSAATSTDGNKVILTYNGALNSTTADKSAFTVTAGGTPITVNAVAVVGSTIELTLASTIATGQTVTVAYTDDPAANGASAIQDAAGNDAASIDPAQSVENIVDTTAPIFTSADTSTDGKKVILTYDGALNSTTADKTAFTVTAGGTAIVVDAVTVVGSTVELSLASTIAAGQTVTIAYTDNPAANGTNTIQDAAGNDAASIDPAQSVTNKVPQPFSGPPTTVVDGATVVTETTTIGNGRRVDKVTIEPVKAERQEQSGDGNRADVALYFGNSAMSEGITFASLPTGVGLTSTGARTPATNADALATLIELVEFTAGTTEQTKPNMIGGGERFLTRLEQQSDRGPLVVNSITLRAAEGQTSAPDKPITVTGTTDRVSLPSGSNGRPVEAIVIDSRALPANSVLELVNIEFAVVVGDNITIRGGEGQNILFAGAGSQNILLGEDDDELYGGDGDDVVGSEGGNDQVHGDAGNDSVFGGAGNDTLWGGIGDDTVEGGAGSDTASFADAAGVTVDLRKQGQAQDTGGGGRDLLTNIENLVGSDYNDQLTGDKGHNVLEGGSGNDVLDGGKGSDTASYASATATVTVSLKNKKAQDTGGAGIDRLKGIENLVGSAFNYVLTGRGKSVIEGGDGNDVLNAKGGTASYEQAGAGVTVSLALQGTAQDTGGAGSDTLKGFARLLGSGFADTLTGDAKGNVITGGAGADVLTGGAGRDTFRFASASEGGDTITDFTSGRDKLSFVASEFGAAKAGKLKAEAFVAGAGATAQTASQHFVFDTSTATLYYDADGNGAGQAVVVAILQGVTTLSHKDIAFGL